MTFYPPSPATPTFGTLLRSFAQGDQLTAALTESDIQHACAEHDVHFATAADDVWTPVLTLWTFLWQVLSPAKSCLAAVARAVVWRITAGLSPCSANTGAYCKARQKLPESLFSCLTYTVADRLEADVPASWLWHGRHVHILDGNVLSAPDTDANQKAYPQKKVHKPGLGFPLLRWLALFSLATGACGAAAIAAYRGKQTGETTLARDLLKRLRAGDIVLGDRLFATYWLIALTLRQGADALLRLHAHRQREGNGQSAVLLQVLGAQDNLVRWHKPRRPAWMDEASYAAMPAHLDVRIVWQRLEVPGFRTEEVTVVTTLPCCAAYSVQEVVGLYRERWQAELNLRWLKQTLRLEPLACKTPEMLRKEIWAHLLGYNLIRSVQAQAALKAGVPPRRLRFAAAVALLVAFRELLAWSQDDRRAEIVARLLTALGQCEVPERPDRVEPRCVKRPPKTYPRLRRSRTAARAALRAKGK